MNKGDILIVRADAYLWRPLTYEELQAWKNSDDSKGMTDDGETKLPPRDVYLRADGRTYEVLRARVEAPRGYGNPTPGCCEVLSLDGVCWYVKRENTAVISTKKGSK